MAISLCFEFFTCYLFSHATIGFMSSLWPQISLHHYSVPGISYGSHPQSAAAGNGPSFLFNTLGPRQICRQFSDDISKFIFLDANAWNSLKISLILFPKFQINNIPSLVQMMAWRRPGDQPLSEPMMVSLLTASMRFNENWDGGNTRSVALFREISSAISNILL